MNLKRYSQLTMLAIFGFALANPAGAQRKRDGPWEIDRSDPSGLAVHTMRLTLYPNAEPRPSLKYELVPSAANSIDGNSAVFYLMAMGFLEQDPARSKMMQIYSDAADQMRKTKGDGDEEVPPYSWLSMPPSELSIQDVKEFLFLTAFQPPLLKNAKRRRGFKLERNLEETKDVIAYLIPEVQKMRELSRMQSLRCRLAIAEGRVDDAIEIISQQLTMARHLADDDFLVSNLVGQAVVGVAWQDALFLIQHPKAPNLYWTLANLPKPLVSMDTSLSYERDFLYLQCKSLKDVTEVPQPPEYWRSFMDRLVQEVGGLSYELNIGRATPETRRASLVALIAAAYPGAKRHLIGHCGMSPDIVDSYTTAQTVFLAVVKYHNEARDDLFKWMSIPYWQKQKYAPSRGFADLVKVKPHEAGWIAAPSALFLPAIQNARTAMTRTSQRITFWQTIEAIRLHGAANGSRLPKSLNDLGVPPPIDPFSGQTLHYELRGDDTAILRGAKAPHVQLQFVIQFGKR